MIVRDIADMTVLRGQPPVQGCHDLPMVDALPVPIYVTDTAGKITYYNQAAADFAGRRPMLGSDEWCVTWRLLRPDGTPLPHNECPMAVTLKEGRPVLGQEAIAERPDGTRVHFVPYPAPLFDDTGRLTGAVNLLVDITEQKRAEANAERMKTLLQQRVEYRTKALAETTGKLNESEQTFRTLVESVTDYAIFTLDADGRVLSWNRGAERIKGYTRAEIIGEHFSRFYTEEDRRTGLPARALATARDQGRFEQEGWRVRKDGARFWANVVIDAIRDPQGEIAGFAKVTRDMTERRTIEEKLRQSQKMDALGQLTGGVAHDFNNLLTVMMGSLEVLGRWLSAPLPARPTARVIRAIGAATDAARRAASLTQRLLAFSRQQPLQPQIIDPNRLVHRLVDTLRRTLGERVNVTTALGIDVGLVHADPAELENALLNLAVNARDAMPDGGTIAIETANASDPAMGSTGATGAQYVLIAVKDNGVGMDCQTLAKAFDPFFTTKGVGRGTGLGLSQVYGFVQQSGGEVLIDSKPGAGATVRIYLPRLPAEAEEREPEDRSLESSAVSGSETILLVEDDDEVRVSNADVLRELGYRVLDAPNAGAALEILDRQPDVHLLFADIGLPGTMNGRQLADKARERRPGTKVLLTTGYTTDAVILAGHLDVGVSLIVKPFSGVDLTRKVRESLDS